MMTARNAAPAAPDTNAPEVDKDGKLILSDEEIARRLSEKLALQAELSRTRGTRATGTLEPTARPIEPAPKFDPAEQAALADELAQAQADLAALTAAEQEAKRQEAAIMAQADRERKDRRQTLIDHAESIRQRVAEVENRARAEKLQELSIEHAGAAQRNAQASEATIEGQRQELERIFRPILDEIKATMAEGSAFMREHGPALEKLAAMTFTTSDASFPIRIRQKLSGDVYRPAERLLEYIGGVLRNENERGGRWDASMEASIREGKLVTGSSMSETLMYASRCTREHVRAWERELAEIVRKLDDLTQQGKEQAIAPPQITITIDDTTRQNAKRDSMYGKLTSGRQTQAVIHEEGERF